MKSKLQKAGKVILGVMLVCTVFYGYLYLNVDIGVQSSELEDDIRLSQKIPNDWIVEGNVSDTMAAYISYPENRSDHTFSVYVNRPGLSFGYFFRSGGDISSAEGYISEHTFEGCDERAFISMNTEKVDRLEINDDNSVQVIDIDSNKPFAIVLPVNAGTITFYDIDGKILKSI